MTARDDALVEALLVERRVRELLADYQADYVERLERFYAGDGHKSGSLPWDAEAVAITEIIDDLRAALEPERDE